MIKLNLILSITVRFRKHHLFVVRYLIDFAFKLFCVFFSHFKRGIIWNWRLHTSQLSSGLHTFWTLNLHLWKPVIWSSKLALAGLSCKAANMSAKKAKIKLWRMHLTSAEYQPSPFTNIKELAEHWIWEMNYCTAEFRIQEPVINAKHNTFVELHQ